MIFCCWEHDTHQDHKALAQILFSVLRKNDKSLYAYEAMLPGGINTNSFTPQLFVNISDQINLKIRALKQFKSVFQNKNNTYSNYFDSIIARAKYRGGTIGVRYAESFQIIKQIDL